MFFHKKKKEKRDKTFTGSVYKTKQNAEMSNMKTKKKRPSAIPIVKNMRTVVSLSDRLKVAGIKELKPQCGGKQTRSLNKSSKKRKSNKILAEKHRKPLAEAYSKDLNNNQTLKSKKILLKKSLNSSNSNYSDRKKSAEETLNVSLDFIKDCQKYKRKFRNPTDDFQLNNQRSRDCSDDSTQYYLKKDESQTLLKRNSASRMSEEKETGNSSGNECCLFNENKYEKFERRKNIDDELRSFVEEITKTYYTETLTYKTSSRDVAEIDKKYLDSVLSLTNPPKQNKKKDLEKVENERGKPKKLIIRNYSYSEAKNKDLGGENFTNADEFDSQSSGKPLQQDHVSVRIFRDSTKSEVQFQLRYKKTIGSQRNSEEFKTEKEVAQSKSELKKRKPRNKILKSSNKELIEIPFSSEVSKTKDVKEIWRRETQRKSENSLTSNSSSTIPETDEDPKWKNFGLQSYRILHKLVEEEINKISKKSESKNNIKEVKNKENITKKVHENKPERVKEDLKSKNILNKLKIQKNENLGSEKETLRAKKKLLLNENYHEGEKRTQVLSVLNEDLVKTSKGEVKLLEAKKTKVSKFPEQTIDNWSIINRLEQAFIALGSSNFQNDTSSKTKQDPKNNSTLNSEFPEMDSKETEEQDALNKKDSDNDIRKLCRSKQGPRSSNTGWVFSGRKSRDLKPPSYNYHSALYKEKNKRNEPSTPQSSNSIDQGEIIKEPPPRKKTCNANSLKNFSVQPKTSNTSVKTNASLKSDKMKMRAKPVTKEEPKIRAKDMVKKKSLSSNKNTEKKDDKTKFSVPKNGLKPAAENTHGTAKSGIPKPRLNQKIKTEKADTIEDHFKNQMSEKKEKNQRSSNERPVKERSILSVHGKQKESKPSTEKFNAIQEKTSSNITAVLKSNTGDLIMKRAQRNFEDIYRKSMVKDNDDNSNISNHQTISFDQSKSSLDNIAKPNSYSKLASFSKQNVPSGSRSKMAPASSISQIQLFKSYSVQKESSQEHFHSKTLRLWEKDIRRYREIVNDIMNQYKRIDGFLKQSERLGTVSNKIDGADASSQKDFSDGKPGKPFHELQDISLQEYRKKIVTEYQALPFFEYKQLARDENINFQEPRKRNLSVVSNIDKEKDIDVKDYQPKITKVLDSQLYVDKDDLLKPNYKSKPKHKKLSLQEILLYRDASVLQQHCLQTYSLPKTLMLPGGEASSILFNDHLQK